MEVVGGAPSAPSPALEGQATVNPNGAPTPLPPRPATTQPVATATTSSSSGSMLMGMVTPPGLLSHSIAPDQLYPAPLAKHLEVVASQDLFLDTLKKFHIALGTRLVIPKMGGKDLDLHVLYVEVTQRGGLQQVIKDRKWKEITGAFNFPRTTTSASYVLRKYYITLLHHYEQLYFFGSSGLLVAPPTPLPAPSPVTVKQNEYAPTAEPQQAQREEPEVVTPDGKKIRKRKLAPMPAMAPVDPMALVGNVVTGAIEGKFEHGYLVTIMVGVEKLRGIIYHIPPGHRGPQHAHVPNFVLSAPSAAEAVNLPEKKVVPAEKIRKRKQKEELKKDPNAPRSNRTGYNFFFVDERAKLKLLYPDKERELSRMIGDAWNSLTEEQKMPYQERATIDKERYHKEMREYKQLKSVEAGGSLQAAIREESGEVGAAANANAGDGDYHVVAMESHRIQEPAASVAEHGARRSTFLYPDQLPQKQDQEEFASQLALPGYELVQYSTQQYLPQHFAHSLIPSNMGSAPPYAPPQQQQQPAPPAHENVAGSEGYLEGSYNSAQPVAHQFMD